ncbi:MAG TPA: tetratricopeptide repeat protein [Candidatus Saccharimonadales bacterium]|jgi:tetratricopeptide (TPR) repeat protein/TolB-like protein|nr:tetratricopeptide repeat protein [Candidatus Saccharimonadales bacterium]
MTPERWIQIKELFTAVVERPLDSRSSALAELCQGDRELQSEIERLLAQHDEMGGFLEGSPAPPAPAKAETLQAGEIIADRYRIIGLLGRGGMGEVYEAEDRELGEHIALKVIRQETSLQGDLMDRLRREVQLARRVTHPNVCRVFDLGHHRQAGQESIFLSMELIKGETLNDRLRRTGKIAFPDALYIARQLCQALGAAHEAGILHRDFKCGNVMLLGSGEQIRAVVTDFGIARWIQSRDETQSFATNTGQVVGTPAYMSPEQLLGEKLTAASDIYSLGLVLYEIATGVRPFHGESSWTETLKRLSADPPAPVTVVPNLDPRWNRTILRCLQRDPSKRFAGAQKVADALQRRYRYSWDDIPRTATAAALSLLLALGIGAVALRARIWPPALPAQKRIAVIPFTVSGGGPADQATANGLSESLTGNLGHLQVSDSSVWVVPWKEVRGQKPGDIGRAAATLGANLVITGELEKTPGKLRLRATVKDARSLVDLRSQIIEIPEADLRTLEDALLERVSAMLQLHVPPEMLHRLPVDEAIEPGAYEFYEQGRGYLVRYNPKDVDQAIVLFQTALDKDPHFALANAYLAYAYAWKFRNTHEANWRDLARTRCERALAQSDNLASAHLALGMIFQETGELDGAVKQYETALQLEPSNDEALNLLSLSYEKNGNVLQAEALFKDALKRTPGSWVSYNYLGAFYFRHQQYAQAEPLFHTATQLAPDNPLAFYNLGGVYLALGRDDDAEKILTKAIAIRPNPGAYSNLGMARFRQGRYADSAEMFQKAVELRPADQRLWRNLGDAYTLSGNKQRAVQAYGMAIEQLQKLLALRPNDGELLGELALYHAKLGNRERALPALARATRISPNDADSLFNAALVHELLGDHDRALTALRGAIQAGFPPQQVKDARELDPLRTDARYARIMGSPAS